MPRDGEPARQRLQQAAIDLYLAHGYDQVTTAEIAARAGVTERTFFRHFADKREVLFRGETALRDTLVAGVADAPPELAPLPTLLWAFRSAVPLLAHNRRLSEPLRRVIAATPALRERQQTKTVLLTEALAEALRERAVPDSTASLAARIGMAAFGHAGSVWFRDQAGEFDRILNEAFEDLPALTAPLTADPAQPDHA